MSALMVILLVAVAMAVSYAAMRSQTTSRQILHNASLQDSAYAAAMTGLSVAIQKMHTTTWSGVGTSISQTLGDHQGFTATYATGDASLIVGTAEYNEYPYRVSIVSTGYAEDPSDASRVARHRAGAVLRLVPRYVAAEPAGWDDLTGNTVCQFRSGDFIINAGSQIRGPVHVRAWLDLFRTEMAWREYYERGYYFLGLKGMAQGGTEYRPFTGPVRLNPSAQENGSAGVAWLVYALGISMPTTSDSQTYYWADPMASTTYQLYPGGQTYNVRTIADPALSGVQWAADPATNPLGLFRTTALTTFNSGVTIRGTLVTEGGASSDIEIRGTGNTVTPIDLPPYVNPAGPSEIRVRLPSLVSTDDVNVYSGSQIDVTGMVLTEDTFEVEAGPQANTQLTLTGRMAARHVKLHRRNEFNQTSGWWTSRYTEFQGNTGGLYWPAWIKNYYGPDPMPRIKIVEDPSTVRYHWYTVGPPLFQPHPDDGSLRWELIRWQDSL